MNHTALFLFIVFFAAVIKMSFTAFITQWFSHGTFVSNLVDELQTYGQGLFLLIIYILGIGSLIIWKWKRTSAFYFQLGLFLILPTAIVASPVYTIIAEKVQLATAKVEDVISAEEFSKGLDFTTLKSYQYKPESQEIEVSIQYNKEEILDWYKERMDAELALYSLEQDLSYDLYVLRHHVWSKTSKPSIRINVFWEETLVHSIKIFPNKDVFENYPYYPDGPFVVERVNDQLILNYEINGQRKQLLIAEDL